MKNIKLLFVFSVLAAMFACEADYEPLNDYSDVDWYTSSFRNAKVIGLEDYLSFSDLSHNETSHSWSFSDNSGCKFLKGRITRTDSTYYPFIDESLDTISTAATVQVMFTKPGLHGIRLRNTFDEFVSFKGADTLEAVFENGEWVIDTTFIVDVYDSIQSAFKVFKDDIEIPAANVTYDQQVFLSDSSSWPVYEIMAGEQLKFVDMTTIGRPDSRTWNVGGGTPGSSSDSAAVINFYRLGDYFARLSSNRTGQNIPYGYKMKYVPLRIRVIQSNLPFEVTGPVVELSDEKIQISLTGEMNPFKDEEENFTVHVVNGGFEKDIKVKTASINASQKNVIELELEEPIYNTDVITVSWAGGNITSLDERELVEFTDLPVVMHFVDLMSGAGWDFEETDDVAAWQPMWDNAAIFEYTDEKASSGSKSCKFTIEAGQKAKAESKNIKIDIPKGKTYTYSYDVWCEPTSAYTSFGTWWLPDWTQYWESAGSRKIGEWVTVEKTFNYNGGGEQISIMVQGHGAGVIYFDNFSLIEKEVRPTE